MKVSLIRARVRGSSSGGASFTFSETNENTFEIDGATGIVTVTVTEPGPYSSYDAGGGAGTFTFNQADLATSPGS